MTATIVSPHPFLATDAQDFNLFPAATECTVLQAALFLRVPEGYINELLKDDRVAFRTDENGEHLIRWDSLSAFEQRRARKRAAVDEIVRLSEEMGLYDD